MSDRWHDICGRSIQTPGLAAEFVTCLTRTHEDPRMTWGPRDMAVLYLETCLSARKRRLSDQILLCRDKCPDLMVHLR